MRGALWSRSVGGLIASHYGKPMVVAKDAEIQDSLPGRARARLSAKPAHAR